MRYYFKTYPDDIPPERKSVLLRVVAVSLRLITREKNSEIQKKASNRAQYYKISPVYINTIVWSTKQQPNTTRNRVFNTEEEKR